MKVGKELTPLDPNYKIYYFFSRIKCLLNLANIKFKIKKYIFIITKNNSDPGYANAPDAGCWTYVFDADTKKNKWIENLQIIEEIKPYYDLKREIVNSQYAFHIDSFPRQGSTTLRAIFLEIFPTISIPDPMIHIVAFTQEKITQKQIIISMLRDPNDTLCSFISRCIYDNEINKLNFNNTKRINKKIINDAIKFYNRYLEFNIKNYDKIYFIKFKDLIQLYEDYLLHKENNNYILKYFSKKYNLPFLSIDNNQSRTDKINFSSSVQENVKNYLINNNFYLKKLNQSYKLYDKLINDIDVDKRGIYNNVKQ